MSRLSTPLFQPSAGRLSPLIGGLWLSLLLLCGCWVALQRAVGVAAENYATRATPHWLSQPLYTSPDVVVSQVYGGGGERNAPYKHDFIELFNRGTTTVNLTGWSVQYASARNVGWQVTELSGTLAPGQYYLIRQATGGTAGQELPAADVNGSTALNATGGRVALVRTKELLSGLVTCPTDAEANGKIVDFVGYGTSAVCAEGTPTLTPSVTTAVLRQNEGCTDTDQNSTDFSLGAPRPRNSSSPLYACGGFTTSQADLVISTITSGSATVQASRSNQQPVPPATEAPQRAFAQTQTTPASVLARGVLTFFVTVRNAGPVAASNVVVSDVLPTGFTNLQASNGGLTSGASVVWPVIPLLAQGASVTFSVSATAPAQPASGTNTARCTADTFDPDLNNNRSVTPVEVLAGARFSSRDISVEFLPTSNCQTSLSVEIKLTNRGYSSQPNNPDPEFITYLPTDLTISSCSASKSSCRINSGASVARWDGTVDVNETITITLSVNARVPTGTVRVPFCLTATAQFDADNNGNNESSADATGCGEYACNSTGETGKPLPPTSEASHQKPGSVLFFNFYTSNAANSQRENTRLSLTNTSTTDMTYLHLFFVNGDTCDVSDLFLCLTAGETVSFLASEIDPGVTGYLVAVAVSELFGCPLNFNYLIGNADIKLASGHAASLGAESFAALTNELTPCNQNVTRAELLFDGVHYNRAPRTLAIPSLVSLQDGNVTFLVLNRLGGDLSSNVAPLSKLSGLVYDDIERRFSFTAQGGCQLRQMFSSNFPRTSPRYQQIIGSGQTGWLKIWQDEDFGMLGAAINFNANANALPIPVTGGQNLHKLTFTNTASFTMPVIRPRC